MLPQGSARTDREIVLEAVKQEWQASDYAAVELRADLGHCSSLRVRTARLLNTQPTSYAPTARLCSRLGVCRQAPEQVNCRRR